MSIADDIKADIGPEAQASSAPSLGNSIRMDVSPAPAPAAVTVPSIVQNLKQGTIDTAAGLARGAGSIGATLLWPGDAAHDLLTGAVIGASNAKRRADIDAGLANLMGSTPDSLAYKASKLTGEVMGTAGIGPALGWATAGSPVLSAALSSGGMSLSGQTTGSTVGNAALRTAAGAVTGGLSAGAVDPSHAGTGAVIGAVTPGAAWLLGAAGSKLADVIKSATGKTLSTTLGATTGTGSSVVDAAYQSGVKGDTSFLDNMRGKVSFSDIVDQAKDALSVMRQARGDQYRQGMASVSGDKTVLDLTPIQQAVTSAQSKFGTFNGQVVNENANAAIQRVAEKVDAWSKLDPATFHTPEGLDKLKQWVGGELENAKPGTQTDAALKGVYNSIKSSIVAQAPAYAKTMSAYEAASEQLAEISRTLSLNPKASVDTSVRKLQSVLRNNVNTNFGNRLENVSALEQQGGANIVPAIAGQSMSSVWPRGIAGPLDAALLLGGSFANPAAALGALGASPRLVGEAAYGAGRLSSMMGGAGSSVAPMSALPARIAPVIGAQPGFSLSDLMLKAQPNGVRP